MRMTSFLKAILCDGVFGVCAIFAVPSYADIFPDSLYVQNLGEMRVENVTASEKIAAAADFVELSSESWEGKGLSAAEVLAALPGIQFYKQGGMGSFQTVSIRGISAKSIIICLDGVPLNNASGGAVNLGMIDLNQIEKIEVYKNHVPSKFGSSGIGGAVNFVSKGASLPEMQSLTKGRVLGGYGSHNSWEASAQIQGSPLDSLSVMSSVSVRHSDNDYEYKNRNGTKYNADDDFMDTRENAQFTEYSMLLKIRKLHSSGIFSTISGSVNVSEGGNPGREDYQTVFAGYEGENAQLNYRMELPKLFDWLWLELGLAGKFEKAVSHSYYPVDHIGYASSDYLEYGTAGYRLNPEIVASYESSHFSASICLLGGMDYYEARGSSSGWNIMRSSLNVSADMEYGLMDWLFFGGSSSLHYMKDELHGGVFVMPNMKKNLETAKERDVSYSIRGFVRFGKERSHFGTMASFGRFYREPQLMELYGVFPGMISNPDLEEETAFRGEASAFVLSPSRKSTFRMTYFETRSENGIYWLVSGNFMKPFNMNEAVIRGVETELESTPVNFVSFVLRATFQNAEDRSDVKYYRGKKLPYEPAQSYLAEVTFQLPFHFDFTWTSEFRSKVFCDRANRQELPASDFHRASLGYMPLEKTRLVFAVNNITDETYRDVYTHDPVPGREFKVTVTQGF